MSKKPSSKMDTPELEVHAIISDLAVNWSEIDKKFKYVMQSATLIAAATHNPVKYDEKTGAVIGLHDPDYMYTLPGYDIVRVGHAPVGGAETALAPPVIVFKRPAAVETVDGLTVEVQGSRS